jgi:uncharacterized protein YegJ (DUF2314 family)
MDEEAAPIEAPPALPSLAPSPEEPTEAELRAFVGPRAERYLRHWRTGSTFNWAGFLASGVWLPYRKLYRPAAVLYGLLAILLIADVLVQDWLGRELPAALDRILSVGVALVCGTGANHWYLQRARRVIAEERRTSRPEPEHLNRLRRRGGTSLLVALAFPFAFVALLVVVVVGSQLARQLVPASPARKSADVPTLARDDPRMVAAVDEARRTLASFIETLRAPGSSHSDFAVRALISDGTHTEHVWVSSVTYDGRLFEGQLDEAPDEVTGVEEGDAVAIEPSKVSDWRFVDGGKLVGGYTIRAQRASLTDEQRKAFDEDLPFSVD